MKNLPFYVLLTVGVLLDGWLLAHPNLLGRVGVWFYDYNYLKTFPRALGTVAAVVGVALLVAWLTKRLSRGLAVLILSVLAAASGAWIVQSIQQFTSGVYQFTGPGFRAGAVLLPVLALLVFGKVLFERLRGGRAVG